jgi:outer membrane receptor protein involved in Fe transport
VTPALITRRRANLGTNRARGLELQADRQWLDFSFSAGYQWTDSVIAQNPAQPSLVGRLIAEVPRHQFTTQFRYARAGWTLGVQARGSSMQFDDDLNTLVLPAYGNLDVFGSRAVAKHAQIFAAVEDITNTRSMVARTPVPTYGAPFLVRAGIRINAGASR